MIEIVLKNGEHIKLEEGEYKCYTFDGGDMIILYGYAWYDRYPCDNILYCKFKNAKELTEKNYTKMLEEMKE